MRASPPATDAAAVSRPLLAHWQTCLLALVSGALITLALAPFDLWPLSIVSLGLLFVILQHCPPNRAALYSWLYGLGLFGSGSSWVYVSIHVYGYAPAPLAAPLTLLFSAGMALHCGLFGYCYAHLNQNRQPLTLLIFSPLSFAALWVLSEWLRSWVLTGFPWLFIGYGYLDTPLSGWAPVTGIFGLSFIGALSASVLASALLQRRCYWPAFALLASLWLSGGLLKQLDWVQPVDSQPVRVAMVQANIPQELKWNPDQYWPTLKLYEEMSVPLWSQADIVIWPEAAIPGFYQRAQPFLDQIARQAASEGSSLVTGIPFRIESEQTGQYQYFNGVVALGNGLGSYHKQRLVPFGEYVPLESLLRGMIQFFDLPMSSFSPGARDQQPLQAGPLKLSPFICYEIVYPDLVARFARGTDLMITISNDAWFGASIGPLQHLQMAQMRALENGRYLLRATGSGVSAIIDQRGNILVESEQFKRQDLLGEALLYRGHTPFSLTGSWPLLTLCGLLCLIPLWRSKVS